VRTTLDIALLTVALLTGACSATVQDETSNAVRTTGIETAGAEPPTSVPASSPAPIPTETEVTSMTPTTFSLTSTAFADGGPIPSRFTCDGEDVSPDLTWSGVPDGTRSLTLIVTDPDARGFVHWLAYDMTGAPTGGIQVAGSSSADAPAQGTNSFGKPGYGGPCPPSGTHRYAFALYALDRSLDLEGAPGIEEIDRAMAGHVLAQTTLTGTYQH